jgi:uncharacterized coiled-coil protein SlyX
LQTSLKNQKTRSDYAEETIKTLERRRAEDVKNIKELQTTICEINDDLERQAEQAKRLADLNEELRKLFEEERKAMGEEQEKLEIEMEKMHHSNERKQSMLKSKLYVLISAFSVGKEIKVDREKASVDDMFKELQELAHSIHSTKSFTPTQTKPKPLAQTTAAIPEVGQPTSYPGASKDYQP